MITVIAGSRSVTDPKVLKTAIAKCGWPITEVVCGMAEGADTLGLRWARKAKVKVRKFPADWKKYGRSAGAIRNAEMAKVSEAALLLWDGKSPGTKNMIHCARKEKLKLYVHEVKQRNVIDRFIGDYFFLSNFFPCSVRSHNTRIKYPSSEHAYQAAKFTDVELRRFIAGLPTPKAAKHEGYKHKVRKGWDDIRIEVMTRIVRAKFRQNSMLAHKLLKTGDSYLCEGNYWNDTFWGVCRGVGKNHLGKILMKIRKELRRELRNR